MSDVSKDNLREKITDLEGFEPPTSGLEARRYILAKPQIQHILLYQVVFRDNKMNGIDIILHDNMTVGALLQMWVLPTHSLLQILP